MAVLLGALVASGTAAAQDWPTRPVTMVVPFAAGGPIDTLGRLLVQPLSEVLHQQVVSENVSTAGRIDYICNIASTAVPAIEGKTVKALAVLTTARSPALPDIPTADEQGLKDFDAYSWNAVFLPRGTRPEIVNKLNAALIAVMD